MIRKTVFCVLAVFTLSPLHAEVSKEFLVDLRTQFRSTSGARVLETDFNRDLNAEELDFLRETWNHDYTDLFRNTVPRNREIISYFPFQLKSITGITNLKERKLKEKTICRVVYSLDGKTFISKKLHHLKNTPEDSNWHFSYCTGADKDSDIQSVIYYFHGAKGNPFNWSDRDAMYKIRKRWREIGKLPRWVSISIGSIGHLAEEFKEERFFDLIVPYIEKEIGFNDKPRKRFVMGVSQGGANVVHAILKKDHFFDAAVAICPAVMALDLYKKEDLHKYKLRTKASDFWFNYVMGLVPKPFFRPDYWHKHVDALELGQKFLSEKTTPLYIQTSSHDQLGLQEGGQIFAMLARTKRAPVMFEELHGGHCVLRPNHIASYFHSFQNDEVPVEMQWYKRSLN